MGDSALVPAGVQQILALVLQSRYRVPHLTTPKSGPRQVPCCRSATQPRFSTWVFASFLPLTLSARLNIHRVRRDSLDRCHPWKRTVKDTEQSLAMGRGFLMSQTSMFPRRELGTEP